MSTLPTLRLAVCLFPDVTPVDFIGPAQVFSLLQQRCIENLASLYPSPPILQIEATYFSHDLTPVVGDAGPALIPQKTYKEVLENFEQYDLILIPGGVSQLANLLPNSESATSPVFPDRRTRRTRGGRPIAHQIRTTTRTWGEVHLDSVHRGLDPRRYRVVEWEEGHHEQVVL